MTKFLSFALLAFALSACSLHANPHRTKISGGGITVETDGGHGGGKAKHCPPGHAKKGWC